MCVYLAHSNSGHFSLCVHPSSPFPLFRAPPSFLISLPHHPFLTFSPLSSLPHLPLLPPSPPSSPSLTSLSSFPHLPHLPPSPPFPPFLNPLSSLPHLPLLPPSPPSSPSLSSLPHLPFLPSSPSSPPPSYRAEVKQEQQRLNLLTQQLTSSTQEASELEMKVDLLKKQLDQARDTLRTKQNRIGRLQKEVSERVCIHLSICMCNNTAMGSTHNTVHMLIYYTHGCFLMHTNMHILNACTYPHAIDHQNVLHTYSRALPHSHLAAFNHTHMKLTRLSTHIFHPLCINIHR